MDHQIPPPHIEYLSIGHLTRDISPKGDSVGGTVAYASLTAQSHGLKPGILTSIGQDLPNEPKLTSIPIIGESTPNATAFENIESGGYRTQYVRAIAPDVSLAFLSDSWRRSKIVHLGPIWSEIPPDIFLSLSRSSFIGITPQGFFRRVDRQGKVGFNLWNQCNQFLTEVDACVISIWDVNQSKTIIMEMAASCKILVVTEAANGALLFYNGKHVAAEAQNMKAVDSTGSGDIFAAGFFIALEKTKDPEISVKYATHLASFSVERKGLDGVPSAAEISSSFDQHIGAPWEKFIQS